MNENLDEMQIKKNGKSLPVKHFYSIVCWEEKNENMQMLRIRK